MKKIRLILLSAAVLLAAGGVMATARPKAACESQVQYFKSGNQFYVAGEYGVDFVCAWDHWGSCTYTYDAASGTYRDCRAGKILWLR